MLTATRLVRLPPVPDSPGRTVPRPEQSGGGLPTPVGAKRARVASRSSAIQSLTPTAAPRAAKARNGVIQAVGAPAVAFAEEMLRRSSAVVA